MKKTKSVRKSISMPAELWEFAEALKITYGLKTVGEALCLAIGESLKDSKHRNKILKKSA